MSKRLTRRSFIAAAALSAASLAQADFTQIALADTSIVEKPASQEEVAARLRVINESYSVGELLSDSDAAFVLQYAPRAGSLNTRGTEGSLNISGSKYGTTIQGSGSLYYREDGFWKTYGSDAVIRATTGGAPRSMTLNISCVTYGILGDGGLVQTYNGSVSASCQNKSVFYCNPQDQFWAIAVFYSVSASLDVTTASGNHLTLLAQ